jgi:hypothetical protein
MSAVRGLPTTPLFSAPLQLLGRPVVTTRANAVYHPKIFGTSAVAIWFCPIARWHLVCGAKLRSWSILD